MTIIWIPMSAVEPVAPRDGTGFLAYGRHDEISALRPDVARGVRPGDHWWAIILWDVWRSADRGGQQWVFAKDGAPAWTDPTHWSALSVPEYLPEEGRGP